jgi:hypothetical protein
LPLIADNIIVFLFRAIVLAFRCAQSASWTKTEGVIKTANAPEHELYPYALITYGYKFNLERYNGEYMRGFWLNETAHDFAQRFVPGKHLVVRVNPSDPGRSFVFERDQVWWIRPPMI